MPLEPASVVIPSWNGAAILRPTLEHLARLEGVEHEILVIDHGRLNRDTEALMTDLPSRFRYIGL
ncbi:glycosyltransferase, partial [Acinetobacter baumannii]